MLEEPFLPMTPLLLLPLAAEAGPVAPAAAARDDDDDEEEEDGS